MQIHQQKQSEMIILHEPMPFTSGFDCFQFIASILGVVNNVAAENFVILFFLFLFFRKFLYHYLDSTTVHS